MAKLFILFKTLRKLYRIEVNLLTAFGFPISQRLGDAGIFMRNVDNEMRLSSILMSCKSDGLTCLNR